MCIRDRANYAGPALHYLSGCLRHHPPAGYLPHRDRAGPGAGAAPVSYTHLKTRGTDLREGVPTLPTILLDRAVAAGDESAREVRALLDADLSSDEALETAVEALSAHPVTQEAWQIAYDWADRAIEAIAPLPDSTAKAALESFAHAVVHQMCIRDRGWTLRVMICDARSLLSFPR